MFILVYIVSWLASIWVYFDAKKFRKAGVPVRPGLVASAYLGIFGILQLLLSVGRGVGVGLIPQRGFAGALISAVLPLVLAWGFYLYRRVGFQKRAMLNNPPLPLAPRWTIGVFVIVFLSPLILVGAIILLFMYFGPRVF